LSPNKGLYEAENLDLVKMQRRVSDLTFEKADLQSLLDQKSKQAESRQKTIEMLEMQLQSTIAENDRLNREVDYAKTRETQAQSVAASSSTQEATLASANAELQATVARLRDAAADNGQALAAEQSARAAAEKELAAVRSATQADTGREDELRAAKEANARLAADNAAIRGESRVG
jgi:chromosome segregation ATPase